MRRDDDVSEGGDAGSGFHIESGVKGESRPILTWVSSFEYFNILHEQERPKAIKWESSVGAINGKDP